jgi:hypothetical protein
MFCKQNKGGVWFIRMPAIAVALVAALSISVPVTTAKTDTVSKVRDCSAKKGRAYDSCKRNNHLDRLDRHCKSNTSVACIRFAAFKYHQSYSHALGVAQRESELRYWICNESDHCGLYQFDSQTFYDSRNPHGHGSRKNARNNALSAMWFWSIGETSRWGQTY